MIEFEPIELRMTMDERSNGVYVGGKLIGVFLRRENFRFEIFRDVQRFPLEVFNRLLERRQKVIAGDVSILNPGITEFRGSMDPHSKDVLVEGKLVGAIQWHSGNFEFAVWNPREITTLPISTIKEIADERGRILGK